MASKKHTINKAAMTDANPTPDPQPELPAEAYFQPASPRMVLEFSYSPAIVDSKAGALLRDAEIGRWQQKQAQLSAEIDLLQEQNTKLQAVTETTNRESQEFVDTQITRTNIGILIMLVVVGVFMIMLARGYMRRQVSVAASNEDVLQLEREVAALVREPVAVDTVKLQEEVAAAPSLVFEKVEQTAVSTEPFISPNKPKSKKKATTASSKAKPRAKAKIENKEDPATVEAAMAAAIEALSLDAELSSPLVNDEPAFVMQADDQSAYQQGLSAMKRKEYDVAIDSLKLALTINPKYADAAFNLGSAYAFKEDYKNAIASFDRTIELRPEHPDPYFNRGMCKLRQGLAADALEDFNAAEMRGIKQPTFTLYRGKAFAALGKFAYAIGDLNRFLFVKQDHAEALLLRAKCQRSLMVYDEAQADYEKAAKLKNNAEAWYGLACMQSLRGQPVEALKSLAKAVSKDKRYKEKALDEADLFHLFQTDEFQELTA